MEGYLNVDLIIDKDDRMHIIDIHGLTDPVTFSENAGYKPRKSRVHRFMDIANEKAQGKKIIHLLDNHPYDNYPKGVLDFFKELPKGSYNINWVNELKKDRKEKDKSKILDHELLFLDQAAKRINADYIMGRYAVYSDNLMLNQINPRNWKCGQVEIPYEEIGLMIIWGNNYFAHPDFDLNWDEQKVIPLNTINSEKMHLFFNNLPKVFRSEILNEVGTELPDEILIGMLQSTPDEILEFIQTYDSFVYKPNQVHSGLDINFLSKEEAMNLYEKEKKLVTRQNEISEKIEYALKDGFEYKPGKILGHQGTESGKIKYFVDHIGSYILQERIDPRPFKSFKTGKEHTGTIRAQIFANQPIGVMHRFSREEYSGDFQRISEKEHKTFWERTDEKLEQKIVDYLVPIFTNVENFVNNDLK